MLGPVFAAGIAVGVFIERDVSVPGSEAVTSAPPEVDSSGNPFVSITEQQYRQRLEGEVVQLREHVAMLEQELANRQQDESMLDESQSQDEVTAQTDEKGGEKLTLENLLKTGVAEAVAEDIINRINRHEFRLLELHDRARREGYLNTSRYFRERRSMINSKPSLRAAIGDEAYDLYLYQTGQNNRVTVSAVIPDTAAQQMGVQKGDVILSYAGEKVIAWQDLRELTGRDVYGDYVNLAVLRDGRLVNILVPRGPLGLKLSKTVIDPQVEYGY